MVNGKDSAYIQALEVRSEYRRRGVGGLLMGSLEEAARGKGVERLTLMVETDNDAALAFYAALDYREFKRSSWSWKGQSYETLCLEKRL